MSTIAVILIVGAVITVALLAFAIFTKPRIDERRRYKARELRGEAELREAGAKKEEAAAAEQRARARRQAAEAEERARAAEQELATADKEHRRATRIDPDS
jgi:biopolymer transport protein ExbB/TolQ